ncbi:hypothetical protein SRHO_G00328290 [Serrasalmus rhombeus]
MHIQSARIRLQMSTANPRARDQSGLSDNLHGTCVPPAPGCTRNFAPLMQNPCKSSWRAHGAPGCTARAPVLQLVRLTGRERAPSLNLLMAPRGENNAVQPAQSVASRAQTKSRTRVRACLWVYRSLSVCQSG